MRTKHVTTNEWDLTEFKKSMLFSDLVRDNDIVFIDGVGSFVKGIQVYNDRPDTVLTGIKPGILVTWEERSEVETVQ